MEISTALLASTTSAYFKQDLVVVQLLSFSMVNTAEGNFLVTPTSAEAYFGALASTLDFYCLFKYGEGTSEKVKLFTTRSSMSIQSQYTCSTGAERDLLIEQASIVTSDDILIGHATVSTLLDSKKTQS